MNPVLGKGQVCGASAAFSDFSLAERANSVVACYRSRFSLKNKSSIYVD